MGDLIRRESFKGVRVRSARLSVRVSKKWHNKSVKNCKILKFLIKFSYFYKNMCNFLQDFEIFELLNFENYEASIYRLL